MNKPWFTQEFKDLATEQKEAYLVSINTKQDEMNSISWNESTTNQKEIIEQLHERNGKTPILSSTEDMGYAMKKKARVKKYVETEAVDE